MACEAWAMLRDVSLNRRRVCPRAYGTVGRYSPALELQLRQVDLDLIRELFPAAPVLGGVAGSFNGKRVGVVGSIDLAHERLEPRVDLFTQLAHHGPHHVVVRGAGGWYENLLRAEMDRMRRREVWDCISSVGQVGVHTHLHRELVARALASTVGSVALVPTLRDPSQSGSRAAIDRTRKERVAA
eukprot:CAMPEP_0202754880 /NCGR_PEP_ID=MMETSP1388-20130828/14625_1 /ASSEMBLY_ACC=CAM_ASM_000864 /TAXON_ID=37098 /ORGANISM="Isochrysis sp, Strain CCMP1244" /LENGTH=184 /DNA_ID=CAMNT_0049422667 /DNA_START=530 /DNA_END=1081 /DNA_ORIENTATION=+